MDVTIWIVRRRETAPLRTPRGIIAYKLVTYKGIRMAPEVLRFPVAEHTPEHEKEMLEKFVAKRLNISVEELNLTVREH